MRLKSACPGRLSGVCNPSAPSWPCPAPRGRGGCRGGSGGPARWCTGPSPRLTNLARRWHEAGSISGNRPLIRGPPGHHHDRHPLADPLTAAGYVDGPDNYTAGAAIAGFLDVADAVVPQGARVRFPKTEHGRDGGWARVGVGNRPTRPVSREVSPRFPPTGRPISTYWTPNRCQPRSPYRPLTCGNRSRLDRGDHAPGLLRHLEPSSPLTCGFEGPSPPAVLMSSRATITTAMAARVLSLSPATGGRKCGATSWHWRAVAAPVRPSRPPARNEQRGE